MIPKYKCPKCGSIDVFIEDMSFSHDWAGGGVEIVKYPVCNGCGFTDEDGEYEGDDWYNESDEPLEVEDDR